MRMLELPVKRVRLGIGFRSASSFSKVAIALENLTGSGLAFAVSELADKMTTVNSEKSLIMKNVIADQLDIKAIISI